MVDLDGGLLARVQRCAALWRARSARTEGRSLARGRGEGGEFLGCRPYVSGEDARELDWLLLARLDQAFVRVWRPAAGARWWIGLDASRSMGLGTPGKLQAAAEVATAVAFAALASKGSVVLCAPRGPRGQILEFELERAADWRAWLDAMASLDARVTPSDWRSTALLERVPARCDARLLIGDLMDLDPSACVAALAPSVRPGWQSHRAARLKVIQILSPQELSCGSQAAPVGARPPTWWVDPESGARSFDDGSERACREYLAELEAQHRAWHTATARVGGRFLRQASDSPFETAWNWVAEGSG